MHSWNKKKKKKKKKKEESKKMENPRNNELKLGEN